MVNDRRREVAEALTKAVQFGVIKSHMDEMEGGLLARPDRMAKLALERLDARGIEL